MCIHPLKIRNKSKHWSSGQPYSFYVPCGSCPECRRSRRNGWFVRAAFHYEYTKRKGGFTYFETLTYNQKFLPHHFGLNHFDHYHIRNFLQRLKRYLHSKYGISFERDKITGEPSINKLDYLITCEYGTDSTSTHRPHYHALFFVMCPCLGVKEFADSVRYAWMYGFSNPLDQWVFNKKKRQSKYYSLYDFFVDDTRTLSYVCKYTAKQIGYLNDEASILDKFDSSYLKFHESAYKKIKRKIEPFVVASNYFGISLIDFINGDIDSDLFVFDSQRSKLVVRVPNGEKELSYQVPLYITTKLYKYTDYETRLEYDEKNGITVPKKVPVLFYTDNGVKKKLSLVNEQIQSDLRTFKTSLQRLFATAERVSKSYRYDVSNPNAFAFLRQMFEELENIISGREIDFMIYRRYLSNIFLDRDYDSLSDLLFARYSVNLNNCIPYASTSNFFSFNEESATDSLSSVPLTFNQFVNNPSFSGFHKAECIFTELCERIEPYMLEDAIKEEEYKEKYG